MFAAIFSGKIKTTAVMLVAVCGAIVVTAVVGSYSSVTGLSKVNDAWHEFAENSFPKNKALSDIRSAAGYGGYIHNFKNYVLRFDKKYEQRVNNSYNQTLSHVDAYRNVGSLSAAETTALDNFENTIRQYQGRLDKLRNMIQNGASHVEVDAAVKVSDEAALEALNALEDILNTDFETQHEMMEATLAEAEGTVTLAGIVIPLLILGLAIIFSWFSRRILSQLGGEPAELLKAAEQLREGDLAAVERDTSQSTKGVQGALKATVDKLQQVIQQAQSGVESVRSGVAEISSSQDRLSQRSAEQSTKLEETSAGMQSMTTIIRDNSEKATKANDIAGVARKQAEESGEVVSQAVTSMSELKEASERIADITSVIDEIAFQTNLLALNAAVEAARAGEHGKGFAVVASEVRNLAQRSASAAKEIKVLIEDSVNKANDSTKIVNKAGEALETIRRSIEEVDNLVSDIDVANREQTRGINEINGVISQLDQFTQENTSLVEETNAATAVMKSETNALQNVISFFRTDNSNHQGSALTAATYESRPPVSNQHEFDSQERRSARRPWSDNNSDMEVDDAPQQRDLPRAVNTDWDSF